jgi:6-pyruvoyltetrahydropterin/6-carboxytetrahydropterin synthase
MEKNRMFTISKQFHFSASHQLTQLGPQHPCARLHGHNYVVELRLQTNELDERGFVRDYHELAAFGQFLQEQCDHQHLNNVLPVPPTAEHLARYFYQWAKARWTEVLAVRVSETPATWAEYRE